MSSRYQPQRAPWSAAITRPTGMWASSTAKIAAVSAQGRSSLARRIGVASVGRRAARRNRRGLPLRALLARSCRPDARRAVLLRLEPAQAAALPRGVARGRGLQRRHLDARHERRLAHDLALALAAHGGAHADGDEPALLSPGTAGGCARRRRRPPPRAARHARLDARCRG